MRERALLLALTLLTACGDGLDGPRRETCRRALPALAPQGASVTVLRVAPAPGSSALRIDYRLDGRREAPPRWIACRFGMGTEIREIATERGPITGASLYLLKRYYLGTPDAATGDPARRGRPPEER